MNINITVAICLYNAENYIEKMLASLEKQTFNEFRLLVIDDGSTDGSIKKIELYFTKNNFVAKEIIRFKKNRGTAYVRNYALHHVTTPLMMFFDADDVAKVDLVEKLYNKMSANENHIAVSCYSKYIDSNSNIIIGGQFIGPVNQDEFLAISKEGKLIFMLPPTLFKTQMAIKANGYRQEGFPTGKPRYQDLSEDLDLWSRMSDFYKEGKIMLTIPEVLFYYRKNTSSLSASKQSLVAMQNKIRYIKTNLKLRRAGKQELDFVSFMKSLAMVEKVKYFFMDNSAFYYRKAGFLYVQKAYLQFACYIVLSIIFNPLYAVDKFKSNVIMKR